MSDESDFSEAPRRERERRELAALRSSPRFPVEDPYPDGTVLTFRKRFPGTGHSYDYAAIRMDGLWSFTGQITKRMRWDELVTWWGTGRNVSKVYVMERGQAV